MSAGLSSPLVPVVVVFQLLWSAAGVKLWRRHQALLRRQWHTAGSVAGSTQAQGGPSLPAEAQPSPAWQAAAGGRSARPAYGSTTRQQSMSVSHFGGGVPLWAVRAPTASGTRWQFVGERSCRAQCSAACRQATGIQRSACLLHTDWQTAPW